jgi:cysteinyl-tRNA synthetase
VAGGWRAVLVFLVSVLLVGSACGSGDDSGSADGGAPYGAGADEEQEARRGRLGSVGSWVYVLDVNLGDDTVDEIVASDHDLVVLDFIPSEADNTDYPMSEVVDRLHDADRPKLVLAYLDVGQAEEYRTYWEDDWEVGDPDWIVALDPDGWEGNFPVAYWRDEWQEIWLGDDGLISDVVDAGFDGIYLDWVEAYSDENVLAAAEEDGVDPADEMTAWVEGLALTGRDGDPGFLVVGQNAAELAVESADYRDTIDAIAQEQVWFDGAADNDPPGDCPLPRTEADVETDEYVESLPDGCRRMYEEFSDSTLHVSSEWYLEQLTELADLGLPVFTADYAEDPDNVEFVDETSRGLGFIPFVGVRFLDRYVPPR